MADSAALNAHRRATELRELADGGTLDVAVIGGGITGAGVALDAASRGLSVALVEKHDLAFGTSRWSSKLVHGGLRYLANGNVGIARRSAVERGIMMVRNAPHLVHAMPQLVPLLPSMSRANRALVRTGFLAGDGLRRLPEQNGALFRGANAALARIDLRRPFIGLDHRRPRLDGFQPAFQMREVGDVLALTLPRHHPRITGHVGDRIFAGEIIAIGELFVHHAVKPIDLIAIAIHRVLNLVAGIIAEMIVLA